jgi:hypothetical protein
VYQLMLSEKSGLQLVEPANASVRLVAAACKKVAENDRESVKTCLERILRLALIESHGSLIAVSASDRLPSFLSDGVSLKPPLDLQESVRERLSGMASDDYRIEGVTSLIRGMLRSDGITVFSPRAKVLAYNCFIRVRQRTTETIVGGARSRAYAALAAKLGTGIIAVFSQSQDGWTKFEEVLL